MDSKGGSHRDLRSLKLDNELDSQKVLSSGHCLGCEFRITLSTWCSFWFLFLVFSFSQFKNLNNAGAIGFCQQSQNLGILHIVSSKYPPCTLFSRGFQRFNPIPGVEVFFSPSFAEPTTHVIQVHVYIW